MKYVAKFEVFRRGPQLRSFSRGPQRKTIKFTAEDDLKALQMAYVLAYYSFLSKPTEADWEAFQGMEDGQYDAEEDNSKLSFDKLLDRLIYNSEEITTVLTDETGREVASSANDEQYEDEEDFDDEDE